MWLAHTTHPLGADRFQSYNCQLRVTPQRALLPQRLRISHPWISPGSGGDVQHGCHSVVLQSSRVQSGSSDRQTSAASADPTKQTSLKGWRLVGVSTCVQTCGTLVAVGLGQLAGGLQIHQRLYPTSGAAVLGLAWMVPCLLLLAFSVKAERHFKGLREIREMMQTKVVPSLRGVNVLGLGILAAGAGISEEAFFRGLVQPTLLGSIALFLPTASPAVIAALSVAATSIVFGALHAVNLAYFIGATLGGVIFGVEALTARLPAAVLTHWLYDWVALVWLMKRFDRLEQPTLVEDG